MGIHSLHKPHQIPYVNLSTLLFTLFSSFCVAPVGSIFKIMNHLQIKNSTYYNEVLNTFLTEPELKLELICVILAKMVNVT